MSTQHVETLVVGAGQAGLATAYHLQRLGRDVLVVDGAARIGDRWRAHYDSLRLFTPAHADGLDGLPFPSDPWHFPTKDEFADYLELYALTHDLPVRLRTRVERLSGRAGGGFTASVGTDEITCDHVVVATGTFGTTPAIPALAADLDPGIRQLPSGEYHRPGDLPDGPVLVVGASHSGLDIALELGATRPTTLVGPEHGAVPVDWESRGLHVVFPMIEFAFTHVLTRRTPMGRRMMAIVRHHGAPQLRVKRRHLEERGVEWVADHVTDVVDGRPALADGRSFDVASVVWATGCRRSDAWIDLPLPVADGWPVEYRGVVADVPGLYFCGLSFQFAMASMEVGGVSRDAAYVARHIARRSRSRAVAPAVPA